MYKAKHSSSVVTPTGALTTPFASRNTHARLNSDYPGCMRATLVSRSPYSPLADPHLKRYFQMKLINSFTKLTPWKLSGAPRHPQSVSKDQSLLSYKVTVQTGHTGTAAKVYITLSGSKGTILRQSLRKGGCKEFSFAAESVEVFRVQGKNIGNLKTVTVENKGLKVNDGFFLHSVSVCNQEGEKWMASFNQWLSLHHSDCQLIRQSKAFLCKPNPPKSISYSVKVHTGDIRGASTGANVFVILHGTKGSSAKTQLVGHFERDSVVKASLETLDLGRITSLTIEHDNSGFGPDWFLDYISVSYKDCKVYCPCAQWLSRNEGDGLIQRTLSATFEPPQPYVGKSYIVTVCTGSQRGAGTDANVYLTIEGNRSCSGERRIDNDPANFERGRTDTFVINCSELGELTGVKVRHDNTGLHPGWFLESVRVSGDGVDVYFPCGHWLELCDGCGGVLQVELEPSEPLVEKTKAPLILTDKRMYYHSADQHISENHKYHITVKTGNCPGASTTANVYVILYGCHGDSGQLWLAGGGKSFGNGCVDKFTFECERDIGEIESVKVGHDNSGPSAGWFLEQVCVCGVDGEYWVCPCQRWLCLDSGDGRIERKLHPLISQEPAKVDSTWTVHVWTSDIRGAGTDANVSIQLHGTNGDSPVIPLGDGVANFEQGEHDVFHNVAILEDIGCVERVTMGHDGSRPFPDWHLDRVTLVNETTGHKYMANFNRWLIANPDGTGVKVKLNAVMDAAKQVSTQNSTIPSNAELKPTFPTAGTSPIVPSGRSLTSQYISQLQEEESSTSDTTMDGYEVKVYTSDKNKASTSDNLHLIMIGEHATSRTFTIKSHSMFRRGQIDKFQVATPCLGPLTSLRVAHTSIDELDNSMSTWHLLQVVVTKLSSREKTVFSCEDLVPQSKGTIKYITLPRAVKLE